MRKTLLLLLLLSFPSFSLMLRPGIYTMHDFHVFRQYEFDKCIRAKTFPCRWAPDAGLGYGEPVFNYYGQLPYWIGEIIHSLGFQIIDTVKLLFILSLVLSAFTMFIFARTYWGSFGGIISAIFYIYAPYRSVDVWVRGALPEALSFVLFPIVLLLVDRKKYLLFSLSLAALILTHNLSVFMFLPFLAAFWLYKSRDLKFIPAGLFSLLLSAFYLLPVIFESRLITLANTTQDYYNYRIHFTTLRELFVSRFWGYGASLWAQKFLSVSAGHLHWIVPLIIIGIIVTRKFKEASTNFLLFFALGVLALFLTHGKSSPIWNYLQPMKFIQFPWRFLSISSLFLSLSSGAIVNLIPKNYSKIASIALVSLVILINFSFFRPDIWRSITDKEQFSGPLWDEQRSSALPDFWPQSAPSLPTKFAPATPTIRIGNGYSKLLDTGVYKILVEPEYAKISFPVVYFPNCTAIIDGREIPVFPSGNLGLVTARIPKGDHLVNLQFKDTLPRILGNLISATALLGIVCKKLISS